MGTSPTPLQRYGSADTHSGYYNPILSYGEDQSIKDAAEAGANGFIMVDLPPEEAVTFREKCIKSKCVSCVSCKRFGAG